MTTNLTSLPVGFNPNYLLCISWINANGLMVRYAMWKEVGEVIYFPLPLYAGQKIGKNFRFEVWSTPTTPIGQSVSMNFLTSVLQGIDYRWGSDSSLKSADPIVTNFNNINSGLTVPTDNLYAQLEYNSGLVTGSGTVISWADTQGVFTLNPSGIVNAITGVAPASPQVQTTNTSYLSTPASFCNPGYIVILMQMESLAYSGTILSTNGTAGIVFGFDSVLQKFTAFTGGVSNITPVVGQWYIILLDPSNGLTSIYDAQTSKVFDFFQTSSSVVASSNLIIGNVPINFLEILQYSTADADYDPLYYYLTNKYFGDTYSLPITFPANAVSQPNPTLI